jgi:hypothetical protein
MSYNYPAGTLGTGWTLGNYAAGAKRSSQGSRSRSRSRSPARRSPARRSPARRRSASRSPRRSPSPLQVAALANRRSPVRVGSGARVSPSRAAVLGAAAGYNAGRRASLNGNFTRPRTPPRVVLEPAGEGLSPCALKARQAALQEKIEDEAGQGQGQCIIC